MVSVLVCLEPTISMHPGVSIPVSPHHTSRNEYCSLEWKPDCQCSFWFLCIFTIIDTHPGRQVHFLPENRLSTAPEQRKRRQLACGWCLILTPPLLILQGCQRGQVSGIHIPPRIHMTAMQLPRGEGQSRLYLFSGDSGVRGSSSSPSLRHSCHPPSMSEFGVGVSQGPVQWHSQQMG